MIYLKIGHSEWIYCLCLRLLLPLFEVHLQTDVGLLASVSAEWCGPVATVQNVHLQFTRCRRERVALDMEGDAQVGGSNQRSYTPADVRELGDVLAW
jgi:hypothetical protein